MAVVQISIYIGIHDKAQVSGVEVPSASTYAGTNDSHPRSAGQVRANFSGTIFLHLYGPFHTFCQTFRAHQVIS
jgi:hypothetical protein